MMVAPAGPTLPLATGRRACERDSAEVGKGHEQAALLGVLDDPLGVLLAEHEARGKQLGDGLPHGDVLDHGRGRM